MIAAELMLPTVAQILNLDVVSASGPTVVAAAHRLDQPVRWLHVAELVEIGALLTGGELLVTTGIMLPNERERLEAYVNDLADVGAAGLIVEMGHRFKPHLPECMVAAAQRRELVLVELARKAQFVRVTEAAHRLIVNAQVSTLQAEAEMGRIFTRLSLEGANPQQVVTHLAELSGRPVVLEDPGHHVIGYDARDKPLSIVLQHWERRSCQILSTPSPSYTEDRGWLIAPVSARDHHFGRLILMTGDPPSDLEVDLVERAASTLALNWLVDNSHDNVLRQAQRTLLSAILESAVPSEELSLRAEALGVPITRRSFVGITLRLVGRAPGALAPESGQLRMLREIARRAARVASVSFLAGVFDARSMGVLLSIPNQADSEAALEQWLASVQDQASQLEAKAASAYSPQLIIAVGSIISSLDDARRSLLEALHVAEVVQYEPGARGPQRIESIGIRGLLQLMRNDERLHLFAQRQLGPLLGHEDLLCALECYLSQGQNKTAAADASHLSRPAFYARLRKIEDALGADLSSSEVCVSLHVALMVHGMYSPARTRPTLEAIEPA